jgi:arsenite methyltransferase
MTLPMPSSPIASSICARTRKRYIREAFRILKPGGRLAISDVDYSEKPAHEVKSRFEATWAGCVGGAMEEQAYFDLILQAGFEEIRVVARHSLGPTELEEMASCPSPEFTPRPEKEDLVAVQGTVTSTGTGAEYKKR